MLIKIPDVCGLVTTIVLKTNIGEVENKIPDTSGLVTTTVLDKKLEKLSRRYLIMFNILLVPNSINLLAQYLTLN